MKTLVRRTILFPLRRLLRNRVSTIRQGLGVGLKRKWGLRFLPQLLPLTEEERFLQALDLRGQTVYDVGAYEGVVTIFFGRAVGPGGQVMSFEPQPENYRRILENVALNGLTNVRVWPIALGGGPRRELLAWRASEFGAGSLDPRLKADILADRHVRTAEVEVDSLDHCSVQHKLPSPDFVKIDVEGLELEVLRGMSATIAGRKPKLCVELHGLTARQKADNARAVLAFLGSHGYSIYHVQSRRRVTALDADAAYDGHLYCE